MNRTSTTTADSPDQRGPTGWRRYWRVLVVAILGAALAFAGSYLVSPTYEAQTQLLIRGRDTSFLTSTGEVLTNQPGVVDSNLAQALGETQSALLSSRRVAERVVDELELDRPRPADTSLLGRARSVFKGIYARARAYVTFGFYEPRAPRDAAIQAVFDGLRAEQVEDSYVLLLTAQAEGPLLAAAIADAAADALVAVSQDRFQADAQAYRDYLASQAERTSQELADAAEAVRAYKEAHGIGDVALDIQLASTSIEELQADVVQTESELAASRAQLASLSTSLRNIARNQSRRSTIETGRSETAILETSPNPVYDSLLTQREVIESQIAAAEARLASLQLALAPETRQVLADNEAELRLLESRYTASNAAFAEVTAKLEQARVAADEPRVEISRTDAAGVPTYPVAPVRYLYLALGLATGALLGLLLTALAARREGWVLFPVLDADGPRALAATDTIVLPDAEPPPAVAAGTGEVTGDVRTRTPAGRFEVFAGPVDDGEAQGPRGGRP